MIIKIKSTKNPTFRTLIKYMFKKKDGINNELGKNFILTHNIKGREIEGWHQQLVKNERFREVKKSNSVYYTHEILSWHQNDSKHLTLEIMEAITKEYILRRNPKGMYIATGHFDKDHLHVHILASGLEFRTGKALRISRGELVALKNGMHEYQISKYPQLNNSVVKDERKLKSIVADNEYHLRRRAQTVVHKEILINKVKECMSKAESVESFYQLLSEFEITLYSRNGKITGLLYRNRKFRFNTLGINESTIENFTNNRNLQYGLNRSKGKSKFKIEI